MATLIGILLDVSASMRENSKGGINEEGGEWARSVFQVIDDLVKHDVSSNNQVFAIGVGGCGDETFDILKTVKQFQDRRQNQMESQSYDEMLERLFTVLEQGGARTIRKWAEPAVIKSTITQDMIILMLNELQSNADFLRNFVDHCLPSSCRNWTSERTEMFFNNWYLSLLVNGVCNLQNVYVNTATKYVKAREEHVLDVEKKAKSYLLKPVEDVYSVHEASEIVHGYVDEKTLTDKRLDELMKIVEPFIYGRTPLYTSIEEATKLFLREKYSEYRKLLFVLSDGDPTDNGELPRALSKFKNLDITIVTCFITRSNDVEPRTLFCVENSSWDDGAKFLFKLSSIIPTDRLYRSIIEKRKPKWNIDITNNETRLFLQVNHPDNIHDACDLAKTVVCSQDTLSGLLVNVSLDMYINKSTKDLTAKDQGDDSTCFAFVAATVIHLSIYRIIGREGGYPDFKVILDKIIQRYGTKTESTLKVLREVCPEYRLQCREIKINKALQAITEKRPVVAIYRLTKDEGQIFSDFFYGNPRGVLSKDEIDITKRASMIKPKDLSGHAVVLTSFNAESLCLMSSWGDEWGDNGFFRVENADVLNFRFIDVFWDSNNLTSVEKAYYKEHGQRIAHELIEKYIGLQKAEYKCPLCKVISLVNKFIGSIKDAICPECKGKFPCDDAGNILAMNIYLTSLSAKPVEYKK
ncbi:uncharacterized protein [Mytilus edulis]|uniref:uncharacterized protein n=1 Tax=Mytilus edulis TaxID=6550 RepID=UPI0039EF4BDC